MPDGAVLIEPTKSVGPVNAVPLGKTELQETSKNCQTSNNRGGQRETSRSLNDDDYEDSF
jgi:hypothetical protein